MMAPMQDTSMFNIYRRQPSNNSGWKCLHINKVEDLGSYDCSGEQSLLLIWIYIKYKIFTQQKLITH